MSWFLNLSTRWKLTVGFGIALLLLATVSVTAAVTMRRLLAAQERIQAIELNNVIDYQVLESNLNENRNLLLRMMRTRVASELDALQQEMNGLKQKNDEIMTRLLARVQQDPIPVDKLEALHRARNEFNRIRDTQIVPLIHSGTSEEVGQAFSRGTEQYRKVKALCAELSDLARSDVRVALDGSISMVKIGERVLIGLGILTLLLCLAMIVCLHRAIAVPMNRISLAASRIAAGDLSCDIPVETRKDEVGNLARAFASMQQSLREMEKVADRIAEGDLTGRITPRSDKDSLAISFGIMAENLQGLVQEIQKGTTQSEEAMQELLELAVEVVISSTDTKKVKRFQLVSRRMEEVATNLNLLVGRIRI